MRQRSDFEAGSNSWNYGGDVFRFAEAPDDARGFRTDNGYRGDAIGIRLGGRDGSDVDAASGAWSRGFRLDEPEQVTLTFWYKIKTSAHYDRGDVSDVRVALDGELFGLNGRDYVARIRGDGDGGATKSAGWKQATLDLGLLDAGQHVLDLGGFSRGKDAKNEVTKIFFDNVTVKSEPVGGSLARFEARVLELTNEFRAKNGKDALGNDAQLNAAAEDWSRTMAMDDFFAHSQPERTADEFGYDYRAWGENIAAGYQSPKAVVNGWISSPGHRANLLGDFEEIGIGYFEPSEKIGATYDTYWTQVFGTESI